MPQGLVDWKGSHWLAADQIGNHLTLVYNKALVPKPPETLDELIATGRRLTSDENGDGKIGRYGLTWNYREPFFFIPFLTGFGGWVMDDERQPDARQRTAPCRPSSSFSTCATNTKSSRRKATTRSPTCFSRSSRTAMIINGPWSWGGYRCSRRNHGRAAALQQRDRAVVRADDFGQGLLGQRQRAGRRNSA